MVRFRVLGPLSVEPAAPRGRRRSLLEALLIRAGEVVGVSELAGLVWPDAAPADPRNAIHVLVGRLRQQLGLGVDPAAPPALITHDTGYRLLVDETCCDLPLFERLARDAHRIADPARRSQLVAEATALWRGEPFAGGTVGVTDPALAILRHQARRTYAELERLRVVTLAPPPATSPAKLRIPSVRADVAPRSRVTERLAAAARQSQVVVVRAPAGYGKSTALAQWAAVTDGRIGWVNLDSGDNEPARFWLHVAQALTASTVDDTAQPGSRQHLDGLLNHLDELDERRFLVLDDYQLITNPDVHGDLAEVLDRLPPTVGVVVACRGTSGLPLARLRAARRLSEVDIETLRFTDDEADELLSLGFGVTTPRGAARTDGWAAGLCLLGLALRERPAGDPLPGRGHFLEYMETEVLDRLPRPILSFLAATCVLEKLHGPLCDAVTLGHDGAARLAQLRELNLFLIDVNSDTGWYRYHHLFADALRERLRRDSPDLPRTLHRRAARWYAAHGCPDDAIGHALAGTDFPLAADLIAAEFLARYRAGEILTLAGWLRALPEEVMSGSRELALGGVVLFHNLGDLIERERWIRAGDRSALPVEELRRWRHLRQTVQRHEVGDLPGAIREGYLTSGLGPPSDFADTAWWRVSCRTSLARALLFANRLTEAADQIADAERAGSTHLTHRLALPALRGLVAAYRGDLDTAAGAATEAEDVLARLQTSGLIRLTTETRLLRAVVHLAAGEPDRAVEVLDRIRDSPVWPHPDLPVRALAVALSARAEFARQRLDAAARFLTDLDTLLVGCPHAALLTEARAELRVLAPTGEPTLDALTDREVAVLRLLRGRLTLPEIAQELWLSPNTVKTHVRSIYRKLRVSSRDEVRAAAGVGRRAVTRV